MKNGDANCILISIENGIQKIVLNRPRKKNSFTPQMYERLSSLLDEAARNENVRMVVLTGNGDFFSSGNELSFPQDQDEDFNMAKICLPFKKYVDSLIVFPKLLVAIVNGPAIGIAVTMLGLFDMAYASNRAYFRTPFTMHGLVAEGCSTYTFPRIMGSSKAGDMMYLGYKMSALEAKQVGLISDVYEHDRVNDIWTYLNKVSTLSLESILAIKRLTQKWNKEMLLKVNAAEVDELTQRLASPDFVERILNFMTRKNKL